MKLCTILGARPQFVKAAVLSSVIAEHSDLNEIIIYTGQHFDANMSSVFFDELNIPRPHYNLGIGGGSHGQNTGRMIESIENTLIKEDPDWLVVYGDTDSTLAGAIAAAKLHIPIAHIEAGLRSFNRKMPEEINRILTDHISELLFTPTKIATNNLMKEGMSKKVHQVGDIMLDAALFYKNRTLDIPDLIIHDEFILCTIHRAENTDNMDRLTNICKAINFLAKDIQIILPIHPRTKKILASADLNIRNVTLIDPISYLQMLGLLKKCTLVITDSGGLQKESFFFRKPCVTMRDETEWTELIDLGINILAGSDTEQIIIAVQRMRFITVENNVTLYGDGTAAHKIIGLLL